MDLLVNVLLYVVCFFGGYFIVEQVIRFFRHQHKKRGPKA